MAKVAEDLPSDRASDEHIEGLHLAYALTRDRAVRDRLLAHYDRMAIGIARKFSTRRETREDLIQVARIGLIHAVERFDPARERPFPAFAQTTILGELKRHLRDHTWRIRPSRGLQEHYLVVMRTVEDLTHQLGRSPRIAEIAARAGMSDHDVLEAMEFARSEPVSLDVPVDDDRESAVDLGVDDSGYDAVDDRLHVAAITAGLTSRDREVFRLRFVHQLTQGEIAARVGTNQMGVSRILARNLAEMRARLRSADHASGRARAAAM